MHPPLLTPLGDRAILIELADTIDAAAFRRVRAAARRLDQLPPRGVVQMVPAYTTIAVYYDPLQTSPSVLGREIESLLADVEQTDENPTSATEIPVCYSGEFGPDLGDVAAHCRLAAEEVIAIHSGGEYLVHLIGFAPGFPYLGGMSPRIAAPRRATPRLKVPAGSVGIAGQQTGIYSLETPGGWQIIGRTPLPLFRPDDDPPTLLQAGDLVRFRSISSNEFHALREAHA